MAAAHSTSSLKPLLPHHIELLKSNPAHCSKVDITVKDPLDHTVPAILHEPPVKTAPEQAAVILVSGAGGGVSGPGGIYPSLATKLATLYHTPVLRLDYRKPARNLYCVPDIYAGMDLLSSRYNAHRFILAGWSFGGAPVFTVGGGPRKKEIAGVATVASQTAETSDIKNLAPTPVLLMHGTGDTCLSPRCSSDLFNRYGSGKGKRELKLFEGDDHGLTKNSEEVERLLLEFFVECFGAEMQVGDGGREDMGKNLMGERSERIETMREGHDLENEEL